MIDYLDWVSDLSVESVFAGSDSHSYPQRWGEGVIYLSVLKQYRGRAVLIYQAKDDSFCITDEKFNCRTRVSEYGGRPFWLIGNELFFTNDDDQCLYHQHLNPNSLVQDVSATRVSSLPDKHRRLMFTDVVMASDECLISIVEREGLGSESSSSDNDSYIASITLDHSGRFEGAVELPIIEGADFYSNLCIDVKRQRIAWVQWDHPNMPWDETQLWVAEYTIGQQGMMLSKRYPINLEQSASVCQLCFAANGRLFFSADFANPSSRSGDAEPSKNFWNIYVVDLNSPLMPVSQVTQDKLEYGYPHWQYGDARIVQFTAEHLLSFGSSPLGDQLIKIDQDTLTVELLENSTTGRTYQNLSADGSGRAAAMILSRKNSTEMAMMSQRRLEFTKLAIIPTPLSSKNTSFHLLEEGISEAQHIEFATRDGAEAYGYYYRPLNQKYSSPDNTKPPPLMVMVHGGPTARAYGYFDIQKQFWTQHGFAVLDVNHRGSSGYGREYRDALYGQWGRLDTQDIVDGINFLIEEKKADPARVCIRGKSAGGYAVLCALTQYPEVFAAGACYYGIGNLVTLAISTHKFEKHYADRMIGETYNPETAALETSAFYKRSPINFIDRLKSAMIVLQGSQDKVVPPSVAHEIVDILKKLDLPHKYLEYSDEGHGFRQVNNNIDAWTKELKFYRDSLRLSISKP